MTRALTLSLFLAFTPGLVAQDTNLAAPGPLGMELVALPAAEFTMGAGGGRYGGPRQVSADHPYSSPVRGEEFVSEIPAHRVRLTRGFDIGRHEVTVGQFRRFVEATGHVTDAERNATAIGFDLSGKKHFDRFRIAPEFTWKSPGFEQKDSHPVTCVSWRDAQAFCEWLGGQGQGTFRLPTEAEWEYACRAGTDTYYSCGNDPDVLYGYGNVADAALYAVHPDLVLWQRVVALEPGDGDGFAFTSPVGSLKPNPAGLYDMHGNVWEWTHDKYEELTYQRQIRDAQKATGLDDDEVVIVDPTGPETTPQDEFGDWRCLRGGGWNVGPVVTRSSMRSYGEAGDAFCYTGFRVVRQRP